PLQDPLDGAAPRTLRALRRLIRGLGRVVGELEREGPGGVARHLAGERVARTHRHADDDKALGIHLVPGVVHGPAALAVGIGADLLDGVAVVAVDSHPRRGPAVLPGGACDGLRGPRSDHVGGAATGYRVARPVRARAAPE